MALPWLELQAQVAARVGEAEDVPNSIIPVGENDIPFFSQPIIEDLLLEISNQMLREINPDTLEAIGSQAINTTIYTTKGQALTTGTIRVLTVSIRPSNTDVNYIGTQPMTPATFVQVQNADPTLISGWAVFNGGLYPTPSLKKHAGIS